MADPLGNFRDDPLNTLLEKMNHYPVGHRDRATLEAELDRRVAVEQIRAANAQVRASWFQLAAVLVAIFALIISIIALLRH